MHRPDSTQAIGWDLVKAIVEDEQGILWLGTDNGIARFDPDTKQFGFHPTGGIIYQLQQGDSGRLWTFRKGLSQFHPTTGKFVSFPTVTGEGHHIRELMSLEIDTGQAAGSAAPVRTAR